MKYLFAFVLSFIFIYSVAQEDTVSINTPRKEEPLPVKTFNSQRSIIVSTNEIVGKGFMDFKVSHNFSDIAGEFGGTKTFFGLDNTTDVRIGFDFGITDRLNLGVARAKGGAVHQKFRVTQLYELSLKYQIARQLENDPSHPISITVFANNVISAMNSDYSAPRKAPPFEYLSDDTTLNQPFTFDNLGERSSQVLQLIVAKKAGRVSLLANLTLVHQGYVPLHDEKTIFALGGTIKFPVTKSINVLVDYIHPFRPQSSKDYFEKIDNSFNPPGDIDKNGEKIYFYDPLGIGFEILTQGHVFHLNFTNAHEILDNRLIPYTNKTWGKGGFRWAFTISRKFALKKGY